MVDRQERRVADQQKDLMLMQRVATGDEQAVEELYGQFGGLVFKVARQLMPSKAEAEDAVQDIFIHFWPQIYDIHIFSCTRVPLAHALSTDFLNSPPFIIGPLGVSHGVIRCHSDAGSHPVRVPRGSLTLPM